MNALQPHIDALTKLKAHVKNVRDEAEDIAAKTQLCKHADAIYLELSLATLKLETAMFLIDKAIRECQ